MQFARRFTIAIGYTATTDNGCDRRSWTFVAEEVSEEDAIWNALREFRREELRTWDGWPRDIHCVAITWEGET